MDVALMDLLLAMDSRCKLGTILWLALADYFLWCWA
jgi:hypothetical protein